MKCRVIVEQDEDGVFVVEVPALPGCISQGKTRSEALVNIKEASGTIPPFSGETSRLDAFSFMLSYVF